MSAVTPTAHYTGYVWARNGLSHPELETLTGRLMFEALQPAMRVRRLLRQGSLEEYLLARHLAIDLLLERAIEEQGVSQVVEIAAGLSPRGWRFVQRFGEQIVYVETDLPEMAAQKRRALERMGTLSEHHRVAELDALAETGSQSIDAVVADLDLTRGLAIVSEGLVGYLPREGTEAMWRRVADVLGRFQTGRHICHIHLRGVDVLQVEALSLLLSLFVRTRVRADYRDDQEVEQVMLESGFSEARVHSAGSLLHEPETGATRFAHVLEAVA
jgi:O-methyltransferase involved in polyketide biosynthesis